MIKHLPVLFICISTMRALAVGDNFTAGARATGMGDASLTLSDVFSTTTNQAGLAFAEGFSGGIYADRRFLNASINNFNGALALCFGDKIGSFGISANYYGYKFFNETKLGLAYARKLGSKFAVGLQFDYLRMFIAENGQRQFFTFETGMQYKPWKFLTLGAHIYNPIPYKVEKVFGERLPTIIRFGLGYEPSRTVLVAVEYQQDIHYKPQFKSGIEYRPIKYFSLRGGVQTSPFSASFGFGGAVAGARLDVSASYHPVLGITPQLSLIYTYLKKKKPAHEEK
ncbi:MAG: hypothetical protein RML37_05665 [Chitinophagales bacterium]|nr:hypothetical protein [Chitinophagales bacterium]